MPLYEFTCAACGGCFEKLVRIGGEKDVRCPSCDSCEVHKRFSTFGVGGGASRLKSSGSACSTCSGKSCSTCR